MPTHNCTKQMVQTCFNAQGSGRILCNRTSISMEEKQCPHTTTPNKLFKHALTHKGLEVFFVIAHPSQRRNNSAHTQLHQTNVQTCFNAQGSRRIICDRTSISKEEKQYPHTTTPNKWFKHALTHMDLDLFFVIAHPSQRRKNSVHTQQH